MYKLMVIIFLSWISLSWATNHYVDKNATGGNNGTSWANAWTSFAAIQWGSVNPGDIVYISGGTDSTVYHESLDLQSSGIDGTAANLITIRNGLDAGHNGKVIIDGDNVRSPLYIRNVSYIRVVGFTIQEPLAYPRAQIEIVYPSNVIYVDSMITRDNGNGRGVGMYGIDGDYAQLDSVFLRYSRIHNNAVTPYQTDCIQVQHMTNLFLIGNYVRSDNSNQDGHSEPAYIQRINNYWIEGNKFIATNTATPHQTFHTHTLTGDLVIFNNLFWGRDQSGTKSEWTSNVYVDEDPQKNNTTERGRSYLTFYNNTVIGSRSVFTVDFQVDTIDAKNNIFYTSMPLHTINRGIVVSRREDWPPELVDYNLYYRSDAGDNIWYTGAVATYYDMADFNTLGAETGGTPSNRNLVDPLFIDDGNYDGDGCGIGVGSPCIDAGVDLPAPYNVDINGVTRLPGHFTIGAYEYANRGPDITPPEVTGATLLDSVTLKIMFSEMLDETTAEDENNYSISNNIDIFNASLSGSAVTLQTATHSPGSYIVTVVNVEDLAGNPIDQSNTAEYSGSSTGVDPVNNGLPNEFSLHQNYPNPFNPSTTISYFIPESSFVTLKVYDVVGNEMATLVNAEKPEGSYEVKFSTIGGSASGGDEYNLSSGIYFYRLQAGSFVETKKMILLK